jgi:hypothetical protein
LISDAVEKRCRSRLTTGLSTTLRAGPAASRGRRDDKFIAQAELSSEQSACLWQVEKENDTAKSPWMRGPEGRPPNPISKLNAASES